jgi:lipid A 3-O-deacylase
MKKDLLTLIFSFLLNLTNAGWTIAQTSTPTRLFRFYEDNDFLNVQGDGTDKAYTNGVRLDFFYQRKKVSRLIDHYMPKAGAESVDIYGWSVMQMMVTPDNLAEPQYQSDDYAYSGALFLTHSRYSYNRVKKYSLQTEMLSGIRGPASFARQTQVWIHRVINDEKPMGWRNQFNTKVLLNINFTAEKQLAGIKNFAEIIGGVQVSAGTLINAITIYPLLRAGKMNPYFDGFMSQYNAKFQFYFFIKPKLTFLANNALMHGDIPGATQPESTDAALSCPGINHFLGEMDFGTVITIGNFSISYTQKPSTAYNKGLYSHNVGNISLYFSW